jgi:hypothetical protein
MMLLINWIPLRMCLCRIGFLLIRIFCEPAIYIKDDAYKFTVDPEIINLVKRINIMENRKDA